MEVKGLGLPNTGVNGGVAVLGQMDAAGEKDKLPSGRKRRKQWNRKTAGKRADTHSEECV